MSYFFAARISGASPDWSVVGHATTAGTAAVHLRHQLAMDVDDPLLCAVVKTTGKPRTITADLVHAVSRMPSVTMTQSDLGEPLVKVEAPLPVREDPR